MNIAPRRLARVAVALAFACAVGANGPASAADQGSKVALSNVAKRPLLLFPVDVTPASVTNPEDVSAIATDVAASRLGLSNVYSVIRFSRALGPVVQLRRENLLTENDVKEPFAENNVKSVKVTKAVGAEVAFVGSVDDYSYDASANQASVTLSGRLVDAAADPVKVIKLVTLTGTSTKGGTGAEADKAVEATRDAAEKLMTQLVPKPVVTNTLAPLTSSHPRKRARNDWLWGTLAVALGVGIALGFAGGGHGGGGGGDNPPAPPM